MNEKHELPDDPSLDPEQAVDAMEENVFGAKKNQERDDDDPDPDHADPEDGGTAPPTTTESPA